MGQFQRQPHEVDNAEHHFTKCSKFVQRTRVIPYISEAWTSTNHQSSSQKAKLDDIHQKRKPAIRKETQYYSKINIIASRLDCEEDIPTLLV